LEQFIVLAAIERERADILEAASVDHVLVVILDSKVLPDDGASFSLHC
jgi:hypothetical protein